MIPAREASSGAPPTASSSDGTFHPLPPPPPAPQQAAATGLPRHPIDATLPNVAQQQVSSGGAARAQTGPSAGRPLSDAKPLAPNNLPAGLPFRPTGRAVKVVYSFAGW